MLVALLLVLLALLMIDINAAGRHHEQQAAAHLQNLATVSADSLERELLATNRLLESVRADSRAGLISRELPAYSRELDSRVRVVPGADILLVLDRHGRAVAANRRELIGRDLAYRYYFQQASQLSEDTATVSPSFTTVFGVRTFTLSRPLFDAAGEFSGVVMATLDAAHFSALLASIRHAPDVQSRLVHASGQTVLAVPEESAGVQSALASPGGDDPAGQLSEQRDPLSGERRKFAWRTISPGDMKLDAPLQLAISRNADALAASGRAYVRNTLGGFCLLAISLCLGLAVVQRRVRQQWLSDARQQAMLQTASDGFHVVDAEGWIIESNPAFLEMLGLSGRPNGCLRIEDIHAGAGRDEIFAGFSRVDGAESNRPALLETRYRHAAGHWVDVELACRKFEADGKTMWFVAARDVTRRKEDEARLQILSQAVEQSQEGIMLTNTDALIEYVNPAFVEASGYTLDELLGQTPHILSSGRTPPETVASLWQTLLAGRVWRGEITNRRKSGELYVESELISPIRAEDGRITHYLAVKTDITEHKAMERQLARHRQHLEQLVGERTDALNHANVEIMNLNAVLEERAIQAEAASLAKSQFLANMSHEIRTPLNAVLGFTQILARENRDPRTLDRLGKISTAANQLLELINDVLDLSKIEAEKMSLVIEDFSMATLIDGVDSLFANRAEDKGLGWQTVIDPGVPARVRGDPLRLRQILMNFASNALKFTQHGDVGIRVRNLSDETGRCRLRFEVKDSGIGISHEAQQRLFQIFEQADASTTRQFGGTGLGLAISRKLVELMGGQIGVESLPGEGSIFWFELVLEIGEEKGTGSPLTVAVTEVAVPAAATIRGRILVVDDEPINREIVCEVLAGWCAEVDCAGDGREAVERVRNNPPYALILMDMQMPTLDGVEATRLIRRLPNGAQVPIAAMTANAFEEDRRKCREAGMNEYIGKPIQVTEFLAVVERMLGVASSAERTDAAAGLPAALDFLRPVAGLDAVAGMKSLCGQPGIYLQLLQQLVVYHGRDAQRLRESLQFGQPENARRIAHKVRGAAASLGGHRLADAAAALEYLLKRDDAMPQAIDEAVESFGQAHGELISGLETAFTNRHSADVRPAS